MSTFHMVVDLVFFVLAIVGLWQWTKYKSKTHVYEFILERMAIQKLEKASTPPTGEIGLNPKQIKNVLSAAGRYVFLKKLKEAGLKDSLLYAAAIYYGEYTDHIKPSGNDDKNTPDIPAV